MTLMFVWVGATWCDFVGAIVVFVVVGLINPAKIQAKRLQRPEDMTDADIRQLVR
ncbi:MAG: hypothetical protein HC812_06620 [Leptolyngbya sp. RL_3_1]|nr:hypothetical protein [Leptolyngbya sp. RL_3_1]